MQNIYFSTISTLLAFCLPYFHCEDEGNVHSLR